MKLENQVCSLELAKRLKELRVTKESIFFYEWTGAKELSMNENNKPYFNIDGVNAYSVAELGEMLPEDVDGDVIVSQKTRYSQEFYCGLESRNRDYKTVLKEIISNTEANARAKMLIYLLENKLMKGVK